MKKRLAALVLATATACLLVGCGSTEATGSAATAAAGFYSGSRDNNTGDNSSSYIRGS